MTLEVSVDKCGNISAAELSCGLRLAKHSIA
jgi:hypothetical protein